MEQNKLSLCPILTKDIDFKRLDNGNIICTQTANGSKVQINETTCSLLSLLDGRKNIVELTNMFNKINNGKFSVGDILEVLDGKLKEVGIVVCEPGYEVKKRERKYLHLQICLISNKYSSHITKYMGWMFSDRYFYRNFILVNFITYAFFIVLLSDFCVSLSSLSTINFIILFFLMGCALFFHELGHIAACDFYGAKHGDIGFGFYLLCPVMFADVTEIWKLPKKEKIAVNLSGIFAGNIFALFFLLLFYLFRKDYFLYAFYLQSLEGLFNLNPLVKYDGYWVLTDLLDSCNLSLEARMKLKNISFVDFFTYSLRDWVLVCYAIASPLFILVFLIVILFFSQDSVLTFPLRFWNFLYSMFLGTESFEVKAMLSFFPQLFFYIMLLYYLKSSGIDLLKKTKNKKFKFCK